MAMKRKLVLPQPLGEPIEGSVIELDSDARYLLLIDAPPHVFDDFMKRFSKAWDDLFGEGKRGKRIIVAHRDAMTLYELKAESKEDRARVRAQALLHTLHPCVATIEVFEPGPLGARVICECGFEHMFTGIELGESDGVDELCS